MSSFDPDDILKNLSLEERIERLEKVLGDVDAWDLHPNILGLQSQITHLQRQTVFKRFLISRWRETQIDNEFCAHPQAISKDVKAFNMV